MAYYLWIKSLHVIAIISWMAGILYLYRLLIYATEQGTENPPVYDLLKTMSRRLLKYITIPAMVVSWIAGLAMAFLNHAMFSMPWFHLKLLSVVLLTLSTYYAAGLVKRYHEGVEPLPKSKTLRFLNEVPTILMIIIVCAVIVKPFF